MYFFLVQVIFIQIFEDFIVVGYNGGQCLIAVF